MKSYLVHKVLPVISILTLLTTPCSPVFATDKGKIVPPKKSYNPAPASKASAEGKKLFEESNCSLCHTVGQGGGCLAPPLNGVGSRRSREFIISRITDDKKEIARFQRLYGDPELMPHRRLARPQSTAIADYLLTLPEPKFGYKVVAHSPEPSGSSSTSSLSARTAQKSHSKKTTTAQPAATTAASSSVVNGRNLLSSKGCMACHSIANLGGKFAPSFDHIGSRKSKDSIKAQMMNAELLALNSDPEYAERGTVMPPMNLSDREAEDIAAYLQTLK